MLDPDFIGADGEEQGLGLRGGVIWRARARTSATVAPDIPAFTTGSRKGSADKAARRGESPITTIIGARSPGRAGPEPSSCALGEMPSKAAERRARLRVFARPQPNAAASRAVARIPRCRQGSRADEARRDAEHVAGHRKASSVASEADEGGHAGDDRRTRLPGLALATRPPVTSAAGRAGGNGPERVPILCARATERAGRSLAGAIAAEQPALARVVKARRHPFAASPIRASGRGRDKCRGDGGRGRAEAGHPVGDLPLPCAKMAPGVGASNGSAARRQAWVGRWQQQAPSKQACDRDGGD